MRAWRWGAVVLSAVVTASLGCAGQKAAQKQTVASAPAGVGGSGQSGVAGSNRYVDEELGFAVSRPNAGWRLDVTGDRGTDGVATPVVLRNEQTGAQVVIQVAPAVATPVEFAQRLTEGMRTHPGFVTSDPEPLPLSDNAVGFRFAMGDKVFGRVAVRDGARGRVLMMLATWPAGSSAAAWDGVEDVFKTVEPVPAKEGAGR